MAFFETPRFPDCIAAGSRGGPAWLTDVVTVSSGHEQRNVRWSQQRHIYDVAFGVHVIEDIEALIAFFHGVRGKAHGFRFKDYADFKSCSVNDAPADDDQEIGVGNGSEVSFQLVKDYDLFTTSYVRTITKPVIGSVVIALDGVAATSGWTVDTTTGIVTFNSPPALNAVITAGYEFDVPCRFDTDTLTVQLETIKAGSAEIPIIEIRPIPDAGESV